MKISVVRVDELRAHHLELWSTLQRDNPHLGSPYFRPEFTQAVAAVRDDVRVGVLETAGAVVGFFPFQRGRLGVGRPVGGPLSDCHGVVAAEATTWDARVLLRGCRLATWEFDHLIAAQTSFASSCRESAVSPIIEVADGFAAYRQERRASGSDRISQLERKGRKLEREVGAVRFVEHVDDPDVRQQVIAWKSEQCRRTGTVDFFAYPWARALAAEVCARREPAFAGALSALYAGDRLVAAHLGMRSERVWHWWFPGYDQAFGKYSPGAILLLRLVEDAAERGIPVVDLGKGHDAYKTSFATGEITLASGTVTRPSALAVLATTRATAERALRGSRLARPIWPLLQAVKRRVRRGKYS